MNKLFNHNGISCGHEQVISPYPPIYGNIAESSWLATAHLKELHSDVKIIRMKRAPAKVIKSWVDIDIFNPNKVNNEFIRYIQKYIDGVDVINNHPIQNAYNYYVGWDKLFEKNIGNRYYETIELDELMNHDTYTIHNQEFTILKDVVNKKLHQKIYDVDINTIKELLK